MIRRLFNPLEELPPRRHRVQFWRSIVVLLGIAITAPAQRALATPPSTDWDLVFYDEFNGTELDLTKWGPCIFPPCPSPPYYQQPFHSQYVNAPDDITLGLGALILRCDRRELVPGTPHSCGGISSLSNFNFTHGYAEARLRVTTATHGFLPAFWLNGVGTWQTPEYAGELDVVEIPSLHPERAYMTQHWYNPNPTNHQQAQTSVVRNNPNFSQTFYTFGLEWIPHATPGQKGYVNWYLDDGLVYQNRYEGRPGEYNLILNHGIVDNCNFNGTCPPSASTTFPRYMTVDYVRFYKNELPVGGDFEDGLRSGWFAAANPGGSSPSLVLQSTDAATGASYARGTITKNGYTCTPSVAPAGGGSFTKASLFVNANLRTLSAHSVVTVSLHRTTGGSEVIVKQTLNVPTNQAWLPLSAYSRTGAQNATARYGGLEFPLPSGTTSARVCVSGTATWCYGAAEPQNEPFSIDLDTVALYTH